MKHRFPLIVLLLALGAFLFGLWHLFNLRFNLGDFYPPYSSLRADPLGTMALYEALDRIEGLQTRRDFRADGRLPESPLGTVYLHLAAQPQDWRARAKEVLSEIQGFVLGGGRLVVMFAPTPEAPTRWSSADLIRTERSPSEASEKWGLRLGFLNLPTGASIQKATTTTSLSLDALPKELKWHSSLVITNASASWNTIYLRGEYPVIVERHWGAGSVVVSTDCFLLSNEALLKDRQTAFLSWLIGPARTVVFDEAHLGLTEPPGIGTLIRRYRLGWIFAVFALLVLLFFWKSSSSLLPIRPAEAPEITLGGRATAQGFVNLIRRNIAPRDLLEVCLSEWAKAGGSTATHQEENLRQAQSFLAAQHSSRGRRDPVRDFHEVRRLLQISKPGKTKP